MNRNRLVARRAPWARGPKVMFGTEIMPAPQTAMLCLRKSEIEGARMATTVVSIEIPEELSERYRKLAESTGKTWEYHIGEAIEGSIGRLEYAWELLELVEDYRAGKLDAVTMAELAEELGLDHAADGE